MPAIDAGSASPHPPPGDHPVGRDLGQRHQHESAFEQARMRQRQVRLVQRDIVIGDDVDVGGARPAALFMRAIAAEPQLDLLRAREQLARRRASFPPRWQRLTKGGWYLKPQGGVR